MGQRGVEPRLFIRNPVCALPCQGGPPFPHRRRLSCGPFGLVHPQGCEPRRRQGGSQSPPRTDANMLSRSSSRWPGQLASKSMVMVGEFEYLCRRYWGTNFYTIIGITDSFPCCDLAAVIVPGRPAGFLGATVSPACRVSTDSSRCPSTS